jgi:hypothetical protein
VYRRLLGFVRTSSERTPASVRQHSSFAEKQECHPARLLVVHLESLGIGHRDARSRGNPVVRPGRYRPIAAATFVVKVCGPVKWELFMTEPRLPVLGRCAATLGGSCAAVRSACWSVSLLEDVAPQRAGGHPEEVAGDREHRHGDESPLDSAHPAAGVACELPEHQTDRERAQRDHRPQPPASWTSSALPPRRCASCAGLRSCSRCRIPISWWALVPSRSYSISACFLRVLELRAQRGQRGERATADASTANFARRPAASVNQRMSPPATRLL